MHICRIVFKLGRILDVYRLVLKDWNECRMILELWNWKCRYNEKNWNCGRNW